MLKIGIDDAGRGPLIGSMFLGGILVETSQEKELKEEGVDDSKLLTHKKRVQLSGMIKDSSIKYKVVESTADQIDHSIKTGTNLNTLEALKAADIINDLGSNIDPKKGIISVVVDCPSVNTEAWKNTLIHYIKDPAKFEISCEHKADANHPSVSAASILAKVAREDSIGELKKIHGDFGSGYPSDPNTKNFLKKNGEKLKDSGIFRKSWQTWKTLFPEKNQSTLAGF